MSEQPDLSQIKPTPDPPPEKPDKQTDAEVKQYTTTERKTPTVLHQEAHFDHQQTLRQGMEIHRSEKITIQLKCEELQRKLDEERQALLTRLDSERQKVADLRERMARLEEIGSGVTWMNLLGSLMTAAGGSLLSYFGAAPGYEDSTKSTFSSWGAALAFAGTLLLLMGSVRWWVSKPNR